MSASFTFGSLGDIITTVQLVWRLSQAISDSHGSAQEFRDLVDELNLFYAALHELMRFWQSRKQSPELDRLADLLTSAVRDCRESIESFYRTQFSRYTKSFSRRKNSTRTIGDVFKRIRWNILEKEKVTHLRDKLRQNKEVIDIVQASALSIAQETNNDLIDSRLADLAKAESQSAERLDDQFGKVLGHLEAHDMLTRTIDENVVAVLSEARITNTLISDVQAKIAALPRIYAAPDLHTHNIAFIEDALGSTIRVPLDIHPSWETVQSMVRDQFKQRPGQELVMSKKYTLQDQSGKDLCLNVEFHHLVRPGQKLAMSMLFGGKWLQSNVEYNVEHDELVFSCPKCGQARPFGSFDIDTVCPNSRCHFVYRRILDVSDQTDDVITKWLTHPAKDQCSEITTEDEYIDMDIIRQIMAQRESADEPGIFKRVHYISCWEDLDESRAMTRYTTINGIHFWPPTPGNAFEAAGNILGITLAEVLWQTRGTDGLYSTMFLFAGQTRSTSVPVVLLFSSSREMRRRARHAVKSLDFISNGRISFVAMDHLKPYKKMVDYIRQRFSEGARSKGHELFKLREAKGCDEKD